MITRLDKFYLEIAPEKTKLFEFGKFAQLKAKSKGTKAVTFNFLGFTHYCSRSRNGRSFRMKRKTIAKLRGHYVYYGVTDNIKSVQTYLYLVTKTLFKWLNRRGKRGCYTWAKFGKLLTLFPLPQPRIMVNLFV